MARHGSWDVVKISWPSTARLELVIRLVEWRVACSTCVNAGVWHVLVVLAGAWSFGALLSDDSELL